MLEAFEVIKQPGTQATLQAVLTFEERQKSRHKTATLCGQTLGWFIPRGVVLGDGDILRCKTGELVRITAAPETVSQIESTDQLLLTRAAYHLGNRHVPLQIGSGFLRYQHDHVLDAMVQGLGLNVVCQQLPFQPENGAYHGQGGHSHSSSSHSHGYSHSSSSHNHSHSHASSHSSHSGTGYSYAYSSSPGAQK